jgi:hypothetical protein
MKGAENPVSDKDQHTQVSSMIMFSLSGFTCVRTVKLTLYTWILSMCYNHKSLSYVSYCQDSFCTMPVLI